MLYYIIFRSLIRVFGVAICIMSVCILLSLISFNGGDPSFDTVSTNDLLHNWMGYFGSYTSDLLFQFIGFSSFLLCLILFLVGIDIANPNQSKYLAFRISLIPLCILSCSALLALLPSPQRWDFESLGGVNGHFLVSMLKDAPKYTLIPLLFCTTIALLSFIVKMSWKDWMYFFRYSFVTSNYLLGKIFHKDKETYENQDEVVVKNSINDLKSDSSSEDEMLEFIDVNQAQSNFTKLNNNNENAALPQDPNELKRRLRSIKLKTSNQAQDKDDYQLPQTQLLIDRSFENKDKKVTKDIVDNQSKMLIKTLEDFGVYGSSLGAKVGPVVTVHEFEPAAGTKASRVIGLSDDIARSMSAISARIAVVQGRTSLGIELPNPKREMIFLRETLESKEYKNSEYILPIILGKNIAGEITIADLAKMPHLLIAGTTGSGKSVGLNVMILSLLYKMSPEECKFIMIDPKMLELSIYDGIPHLLSPVVTEPGKAVVALKWVVSEMEERYRLLSSFAVRNIAGYNEKVERALASNEKLIRKVQTGYDSTDGRPLIEEIEMEPKKLPFIVVIVDEMADLMLVAGKEIEGSVQRLAQMARAAGIHLIMATQRPSVDVITGVIKANFPTRISFQVTSKIDSRTILGVQGSEQLLGQGDMIYMSGGSKMIRVHGPFCSDNEIELVVSFIKAQADNSGNQNNLISFDDIAKEQYESEDSSFDGQKGGSEEDIYKKAVSIVIRDKKPSISYVQRQLRIGYNRAANLIERMEREGIITEAGHSGKREVIGE